MHDKRCPTGDRREPRALPPIVRSQEPALLSWTDFDCHQSGSPREFAQPAVYASGGCSWSSVHKSRTSSLDLFAISRSVSNSFVSESIVDLAEIVALSFHLAVDPSLDLEFLEARRPKNYEPVAIAIGSLHRKRYFLILYESLYLLKCFFYIIGDQENIELSRAEIMSVNLITQVLTSFHTLAEHQPDVSSRLLNYVLDRIVNPVRPTPIAARSIDSLVETAR